MRFSTALALCISLSLACGACRKEANELVNNHDHHHAHDDHDHHHDHDHDEHDQEHHHDHNHEHHNHEGHNHEHTHSEASEPEGVITLSPEVAARFGLTTQKVESRQMSGGIAVSGTVAVSDQATSVVSAPMAGVVTLASGINVGSDVSRGALVATVKAGELAGGNPVQVAKVELDAAKAEYDRIAALYADRLVTLSEYNAAKAAYSRAQAAYSAPAASGRATAPASGVVTSLNVRTGEAVEAGQPIATIASGSSLTLTAMMPVNDYARLGMPHDARVTIPYTDKTFLVSEQVGRPAASANAAAAATGGYVPVVFTVPASSGLVPGTAVEVFLMGPAGRQALSVPRKALMEQQGTYSVYVRLDEDCYLQMPVTVGATDGMYTEILSGLKGGENVVVDGVTAVRLASMSGNVPEGHSHSH